MSVTGNDIWRTIGFLEEDCRGLLTKLHDLRMMLAAVDLPRGNAVAWVCEQPNCGIEKTSEKLLRDHLYLVHGLDEYAPVEDVAVDVATEGNVPGANFPPGILP